MTDAPERSDAALAAEYVLGLLPETEQRRIEARMMVEPALVAEVAFWNERFADLAEAEVLPVAPPPQVKTWTEATIFGAAPPKARRRSRPVLTFSLGALLGAGAVAAAVAAVVAVQSGLRLPVDLPDGALPAPGPAYAARLDVEGAELFVLARTAAGGRAGLIEVGLVRHAPPEGRVLELWLIADGAAPSSLGILPAGGRIAVPLGPALAERLAGARLAISDEPPGGAPTGSPTGALLGTVALAEILTAVPED